MDKTPAPGLNALQWRGGSRIAAPVRPTTYVPMSRPAADLPNVNLPNDQPFGDWQQHSVLIVDDEPGMRSFLERALKQRCGLVETAASAEEGARLIERYHFDVIILDIALPGKTGVQWLQELRDSGCNSDVILITAFADMETAIDALRAGASDFILKPFRVDQMLNAVKRCIDRSNLARENFVLKREVAASSEGMIGESTAIRQISAIIKRLAPLRSTVLIEGESGTGKEIAARALHRMSSRAEHPFVPLNCAAISPELIESELFGHVRGAFTGATQSHSGLFFYAQGGTIFLDEISELPLPLQGKLLRVLEDRRIRPVGSEREVPVDVRIIAATNRDLAADVATGRFRQDLFYRLDVVTISIPPLRDRPEDIPPLARHFNLQIAAQLNVAPVTIGQDDVTRLQAYGWPGNARELRNFMERSLILGYLPLEQFPARPTDARNSLGGEFDASLPLHEVEKQHIVKVLRECAGNKSEAARRLALSRKTLERKCALWGLDE
jgi:DNA-binding NtrC family response regulator